MELQLRDKWACQCSLEGGTRCVFNECCGLSVNITTLPDCKPSEIAVVTFLTKAGYCWVSAEIGETQIPRKPRSLFFIN